MALGMLLRKVLNRISPSDPLTVVRARGARIGRNFHMMSGGIIDPYHAWHIEIGDDVALAPRVHILAHDASTKLRLGKTRIGKVKIGDRVFLGAGVIVLPGVTIGDDVIVGAGSVVSRDIPAGQVAIGNPAKPFCPTDEYLARKREEMDRSPQFGAEYTLGGGITEAMKAEMNERIGDGVGYVV